MKESPSNKLLNITVKGLGTNLLYNKHCTELQECISFGGIMDVKFQTLVINLDMLVVIRH